MWQNIHNTTWSAPSSSDTPGPGDLDPEKRPKFDCHLCDKSFSHSPGLCRHIKSAHKKINPHTCDECGKSFACNQRLDKHAQTHLNPNKRHKFRCKECNKSCFTQTGLDRHVTTHHNRPKMLTCSWPGCQWVAALKSELHDHIEAVHEKLYQYPCPAGEGCSKMFKRKGCAQTHFRRAHLQVHVSCPLASCHKTFANITNARAHYRRVHEGDSAKWRCPHCQKLICDAASLMKHIKTMHKARDHEVKDYNDCLHVHLTRSP